MSYDLTFWRQEDGVDLAPKDVYRRLLDGEPVSGLVALDVEAVLAAAHQRFPGLTQAGGDPSWLLWTAPDEAAALELSWSDRHIHAVCRAMTQDDMNAVIDLGLEAGCALYDPQLDERFGQPAVPARPTAKAGRLRFWRRG